MSDWTRIPAPIESETDRRQLAGILTSVGLEVRIVKEKKTPKSCSECRAVVYYGFYGYCGITKNAANLEARNADCPLIFIPPHGRLIDADAFIKSECNSCDGACESVTCECLNCEADCRCDFMKDIAGAPTIIEAEVEDNA